MELEPAKGVHAGPPCNSSSNLPLISNVQNPRACPSNMILSMVRANDRASMCRVSI